MKRSTDRILTTHAGSLPRSVELVDLLARTSRREAVDPVTFQTAVTDATWQVAARQLECGVDVGNNGEQPRESFFTYVQHRLTGFGGEGDQPRAFQDMLAYPSFRERILAERRARPVTILARPPKAIGEVRYADRAPLEQECASFAAALAAQRTTFVETFMTAPSPGIVATGMANAHYERFEDYVNAVAEALRTEYEYIVAQGHVLQIDAPDLAMERHVRNPLPDTMLLLAGVIDTTTNYVEHPEVVADRIETAARAVGDPQRVVAATDCGFGTAAGSNTVAEELVWEKLRTLRQGADIATQRLFVNAPPSGGSPV
jgi:methionine synthase II (cobalamin-independent)